MKLDLNAVVRDATELLKIDFRRRKIRLTVQLADPLPDVSVDPVQIQQILVNLIRNALDILREDETTEENRVVTVVTHQVEEIVEVAILDRSPGLGENVEKIFDAFFTTRENGMGLGLRISRSIAEAHGGRLLAANRPNGGAVFRLQLPVATDSPPALPTHDQG